MTAKIIFPFLLLVFLSSCKEGHKEHHENLGRSHTEKLQMESSIKFVDLQNVKIQLHNSNQALLKVYLKTELSKQLIFEKEVRHSSIYKIQSHQELPEEGFLAAVLEFQDASTGQKASRVDTYNLKEQKEINLEKNIKILENRD